MSSDRPRILVVGSLNMDMIAQTSVFPKDGQTVKGRSFRKAPGGKGLNQAVQAARLGADVVMAGKVGCDAEGDELIGVCRQEGIDVSHILRDTGTATGCAMILVEERPDGEVSNRIIVIPGANGNMTPDDIAFLESEAASFDMVLLQFEIPMEVDERAAFLACEAGVPVMVNPAPSAPVPRPLLDHCTYLSPNETEASDLAGVPVESPDGADKAARILLQSGVRNVLITLGETGAVLYSPEGGKIFCPAVRKLPAADPTSAGDSFVSSFCTALADGADHEQALFFAAHAAALTVSEAGAVPSLPDREQVLCFIDESRR